MYWFKYTAFTVAGIPAVWVIVYGTPDWWPGAVRRWLEAQPTMAAPFALLLLCACMSRFNDAGSTAVALRGRTLREGAPTLGSSPDYAVLFRLAAQQSVGVIVLTPLLVLVAVDIARGALLLVTFVSACAVTQNLILFLGHSSLPDPPKLPHEDEDEPKFSLSSTLEDLTWPKRTRHYTQVEALHYNHSVWEYNVLGRLLELVAVSGAVIVSNAVLLFAFFFDWRGRVSLLATFIIGSTALVVIGRIEGHKHRQELAALQREAAKKEQLRLALIRLKELEMRPKVD